MKSAGEPIKVNITGYVFGACNGENGEICPCTFRFANANADGGQMMVLPCFSTVERMKEMYARVGQEFDEVETIAEPRVFVTSVPREVTVVVDLHWVESIGWKFMRVILN